MKKLFCLLSIIVTTNVWAADVNGLGLILGDPSGLTFQHRLSDTKFVDLYLATSWHDELVLMGDYKTRLFGLIETEYPIVPYVGIGAFFKFNDRDHDKDLSIGLRIPLGIDWKVPKSPVTVFGELVPALRVIKHTDGDLQGGVGARYYF